MLVAIPVPRPRPVQGAVVVGVTLDMLQALVRRERWFSVFFVCGAVLAVTLLVSALVRPYVHARIEAILDTMTRAGAGDLAVRAPVPLGRRDRPHGRPASTNCSIARSP